MNDTVGGYGRDYGEHYGIAATPPEILDVATLGETPLGGGFMGPQTPPGYRLEVGGIGAFESFISLSVNRRHTGISDWSATVPHRLNIEDRTLASVRLKWGDTILFNGRLEGISGDLGSPVVSIDGRGLAADLTRGDVTLDLSNVRYVDAIRQTWNQNTNFDATVIAPDDSDHPAMRRITTGEDNGEYSGTPMDVLKTLHQECGMRFTVLHSRPGRYVESYPIGSRRRRHDWDVLGGDRDVSAKDYANRVVVKGEFRSDGTRLIRTAEDAAEIATMAQRGIGNDGRVTYPIDDRTISDPEKAQSMAGSKLMDLVDKDSIGGSLDVSPTVAAPGYSYFVPEMSGPEPEPYGEGVYGAGAYGTTPGQYVSLNKISYGISRGEESCSLDFSRREGFAQTLEKRYRDSR